jgi:hypothetical protein
MTTINPTGAGSNADRLNPTLQSTLSRLGKALTLRDGKGAQGSPTGDSLQISPAAASALAAPRGLDRIGVLLADLETLVAQAADDHAGTDVRAEAQRRIDEAVAQISQIAGSGSVAEVGGRLDAARGYSVVNRHDAIENVAVTSDLKQGERLDVEMTILHSANIGGFFLSFGGTSIDLGTGSSFVFQVAGVGGARTFSFASGTSLTNISDAINSFEDETGVHTSVSATGIRLDSAALGANEFVAVQILDDGSIAEGDGIHTLLEDDPSQAMVNGSAFSSQAASDGLTDFGRDYEIEINGEPAQVDGSRFSASLLGGRVEVAFDLDAGRGAPHYGGFPLRRETRAFTVIGGRPGPSFLSDKDNLIENIRVQNRALGRGESFDVQLDANQQAERAGVFLRLGAYSQSSVVGGTLDFTIEGPDGAVTLVLFSGQSLTSVMQSINDKSDELGVQAVLSNNNLLVVSNEFGDDEHISLKINKADFYQGTAGTLSVKPSGAASLVGGNQSMNFLALNQVTFEDSGSDVRPYALGVEFSSVGRHVVGDAINGDLHFEFDFALSDQGPGWHGFGTPRVQDFHAFTIHGADGVDVDGPPIGDIPLPGPSPAAQALALFTTGGSSAGDFVAALDAIRSLRDRVGPAVNGDLLASIRSELIASAGRSLGITAPTDAGRALELLSGPKRPD